MISQRTLRRKLQKKLKHKPYRKCPQCGERMEMRLFQDEAQDVWRLFKYCGDFRPTWGARGGKVGCKPTPWRGYGCGYFEELFWSGGGKADTYPASAMTEARKGMGKG